MRQIKTDDYIKNWDKLTLSQFFINSVWRGVYKMEKVKIKAQVMKNTQGNSEIILNIIETN